jgi:hypothetical protein
LRKIGDNISDIYRKIQAEKSSSPQDPGQEQVIYDDILDISAKTAGCETLALKGISDLNIPQILMDMFFTPKEISLVIAQLVAKMLHPTSEEGTSRWLLQSSSILNRVNLKAKDCYPMALHRVSDLLGEHKQAIEDHMFNDSSLFDSRKTLIFMDLTNTFFEGNVEDVVKAKRGFSKEKRFDCKLITLAACINQEGFIIQSQFHAGNIS